VRTAITIGIEFLALPHDEQRLFVFIARIETACGSVREVADQAKSS
jgi:hypothetical protein